MAVKTKGSGIILAGAPRVDLMPRSEIERRKTASLINRWIAAGVVAALLAGAVVAGAYWLRVTADQNLRLEQARTRQLESELQSLSEVSNVLTERTALGTFRSAAVGNDIEWSPLFEDIAGVLPKGVTIDSYTLEPGTVGVLNGDGTQGLGLSGHVELQSEDPINQNDTVDALRTLPWMQDVDAGQMSADTSGGFTFTVNLTANQTIYSGKFTGVGGAQR